MLRFLALALLGATMLPGVTTAQQQRDCLLDVITAPGSESRYIRLGDEVRFEARGGVEATCGASWVKADSADYYEGRGVLYLYGNVEYRDDRRTLVSDRATYFADEARVRAEGNVELIDRLGGSTLTGPILDYFPLTEQRGVERIFAPRRPHLTAYMDTTSGAEPFDIDADQIHIYGESLVAAAGRVVAVRQDMTAFGDSMHLDLAGDLLWLLGEPRIEANNVELEGDTILVTLEEGSVRDLRAWPNGSAVGQDLSIAAPLLLMFVEGEDVSRLVAWPGEVQAPPEDSAADAPRARGETQDYVLIADSIEVQRPGGVMDRVVAVGRARAEASEPAVPGDPLLGTDWIDGDTITGFFERADTAGHEAAAPDSALVMSQDTAADGQTGAGSVIAADSAAASGEVTLRRLIASGSARALYHIFAKAEEGEAAGPPAVNYVLGNVVTIWLQNGEVEKIRVIGPSTGVYLEPLPPATNGDTIQVPPDSLLVPGNTEPADTASSTSADLGRE